MSGGSILLLLLQMAVVFLIQSISDSLPDWFENISSNIQWLDLSHNQITGNFPKLGTLYGFVMRVMYLNSNKFEGPLTGLPSDVKVLDLSNNFLRGQIPPTISKMMPSLECLYLSNNQLNGHIPTSLCEFNLSILDLSNNQLSGEIPQCWQGLDVLDLSNNNLSGHIPVSLGFTGLRSLHLEKNNLHGKIPTSLQNLRKLFSLDLSENAFVGSISPLISDSITLQILSIHSNMFDGEIPPNICNLIALRVLNLANNKMTGTIPPCFYNFTLMLSDHSDFIDDWLSFFAFPALYQMSSRSSAYDEHVSTSMKGRELLYNRTVVQYLYSVDLSENNFFGQIPNDLMNLSMLENLNLSGNNFTGHIPPIIGKMKSLESLDLSRNQLSGSIPPSIADLNFLSYLNLSFNKLSGTIPRGNQLQTLNDKSIYIGNNGLCGPPLEICQKEEQPNPKHPELVEESDEEESESEKIWFYSGLGVGFFAGYVGFCSALYFNDSWRNACFQLADKIYNKLWVIVAIRFGKRFNLHRQL